MFFKKDLVIKGLSFGTIFSKAKKGILKNLRNPWSPFLRERKAISPVVATSLLLVVAVTAVVGFNTWYDTFSSSLFVDTELKSNNANSNIGVEDLIGENLYIQTGTNNLSISAIEIEGIDCNISGSYNGMQSFNVSSCLSNLSVNDPEIVVITENGILSEYVYYEDANFTSTLASLDPLCTDIELIMHFNNDSSVGENDSFVYDHTGNGHNSISVGGDTTFNSNGMFGTSAIEFDGTNDYLDINFGKGINASSTNLTYAIWVKWNYSLGGYSAPNFFSQSALNDSMRTYLGIKNISGSYRYGLGIQGSNYDSGYSSFGYDPFEWTLYVLTMNGSVASVYGNNSVFATSKSFTNLVFNYDLRIGSYFWGIWDFGGYMDELMVWDRVLNTTEISQLYSLNSELDC